MRHIRTKFLLLCFGTAMGLPASAQFGATDIWWLCPADRELPIRPDYLEPVEPGSTEIRADTTRIVKDGITEFAGNVEIVRDSRSVRGDVVTYNEASALFEVQGNATIWDSSLIWQGEHALFNMDSDLGQLKSGNYWLASGRGRGWAGLAEDDRNANVSVMSDVDYTTCAKNDPDWQFSASKIKLNHEAGRGSATNALLKVRDVPVFYFPYINFPLDNRRKSGFLMPTIGSSNESGFDFRLPYYFNIAPNMDATVTPRVLADRGAMLGGEFRYMGENYRGQLGVEVMPSDDLANDNTRSSIAFRHEQRFAQRRGRLFARFENVSDAQYFEDFGRSLSVTSQRFLDRSIRVQYQKPSHYRLTGIVQSYQRVDDSAFGSRGPYKRLPQVAFATTRPARHLKLTPNFGFSTAYFDRNDSVTGGRIDFSPRLAYAYIKPYLRVVPSIGLRHTEYFLGDVTGGPFDDRATRTLPIASLNTSLFMDRRIELFGKSMLQTFEPRVFYVYIPKEGQDDIPIFDSGRYNVTFRNLFQANRFAGGDRIGDANQIALAATTRFVGQESGLEYLRASFGQIYYFEDREINFPGQASETDDVSDIVAELSSNLGNGWSGRAILTYDPNNSRTKQAAYNVRYRPAGTGIVFNAGYRRRLAVTDIEQTDVSFRVPVTPTISLLGRWNYSLETDRTLELVGGVEVESCCWGMRLVGRRFIRNTQAEFDTGIFLQFEFKGLAGYGRSTASFLRKSIPGYENYF